MLNELTLKISLHTLKHLGINMYSTMPAVLSEIIANCWDADSSKVNIITTEKNNAQEPILIIQDNGCGMTREELQNRYLHVGYDRREHDRESKSPQGRKVMGRKGIGKLSLFSMANIIQIETMKDSEKSGIILDRNRIEADAQKEKEHIPQELDASNIILTQNGTKITISNFTKRYNQGTTRQLKTRIARKFDVFGDGFKVFVDNQEISFSDRDYFKHLQYIWFLNESSKNKFEPQIISGGFKGKTFVIKNIDFLTSVSGFLSTFETTKNTKVDNDEEANLNKITIYANGKVGQEDILPDLANNTITASYLIGDVNADFMDDGDDDIAVSSRQGYQKDNERYQNLVSDLRKCVNYIIPKWKELREDDVMTDLGSKYPSLNKWYEDFNNDKKKYAKKLFGTLNSIRADKDEMYTLYKNGIMAFEKLAIKGNLSKLDTLPDDTQNFKQYLHIFEEISSLEGVQYAEIISTRLRVIQKLQNYNLDNELETEVQQLIYENLWLIEPGWDKVNHNATKEETFKKKIKFNDEEKSGRFDIKLFDGASKNIVIELKRPNSTPKIGILSEQIEKYSDYMKEHLPNYEIICLLGKKSGEWLKADKRATYSDNLKLFNARVVWYDEIVHHAEEMYRDFLDKYKVASTKYTMLEKLKEEMGVTSTE